MMDCIIVAGLLFLVGEDWNGDRYMINIDEIVSVSQNMELDQVRPRTIISTTNGMIVEDVEILDVAVGISRCEYYYMQPGEPVE
jgi:hypothetical protein